MRGPATELGFVGLDWQRIGYCSATGNLAGIDGGAKLCRSSGGQSCRVCAGYVIWCDDIVERDCSDVLPL